MTSVELRRLVLDEMDTAALIHRASFDDRFPWLKGLHTPAEDQWFYRNRVFPECSVWGALQEGIMVGLIAFREGWIDQLYVLPTAQSKGVGSALLGIAKSEANSLQLWTFQRNSASRQFYEHRGFIVVRETDGSGNEEREPDVLYRWMPS